MAAVVLGMRGIVAVPGEVASARRWLLESLADDHPGIVDDVVLMASEVVTNAICHSDSGRGEPGIVTLIVLDATTDLRIEVIDAGSQNSTPILAEDDPGALSGRGLHLLDALSHGRWGSCADADGRTVWFEIPYS